MRDEPKAASVEMHRSTDVLNQKRREIYGAEFHYAAS